MRNGGTGGGGKSEGGKGRGGPGKWRKELEFWKGNRSWEKGKKRKRNLIVKGVKELNEEEEGFRKNIGQIIMEFGVEVTIGEVRKLEAGRKEWGSMVLVEVGSKKERRNVLESKSKLKGEEIWIEGDLTWRERRVKWIIKQQGRRWVGVGE